MKAFTLIEILLALSLTMIVALVASPFYGKFLFVQNLSVAVDELRGSLEKARLYKMAGRGGSAWGVRVSEQTITLFRGESFGSRDSAFDETFDIPARVTLTASDDVLFGSQDGLPNVLATYTATYDGETKTYTLNAAGVLIED